MPLIQATSDVLTAAQRTDIALLKHLRPFVFGNKAKLHRFSKATEKTGILVGDYDPNVDQTYDFPGKLPTSLIDDAYTKVWIENALLNYFNDYIGSGQTIAPVAGHNNRVRSAGLIFKTANDYSRTASFYDRDVTVGDIVYVRGIVSTVEYTLWTSVAGFVADQSAAVTATATSDTNNKSTQSLSTNISQVAGTPLNDVEATANGAAYNSLADGFITRTYTITVTQGSVGGDATTGLLQVTSADGGDDVADVVPAAFGAPTAIGTKGLTVTFAINAAASSPTSLWDEDDFVVGQQWTVTVNQAFTVPTPVSSGTYTGPSDTTYIVRVTLGGKYTDSVKPQITVSTSTGIDSSGPTTVTATATDVTVGNYDVEIQFNQTALCKGDIYYIPVTAAADAQVRTLVLTHDMPAGLLPATDIELRLFIKETVQVSRQRSLPDVGVNWSQTADDVTVEAGLDLTTTGLTDGGDAVYVPVQVGNGFGKLYIEYREWDIDLAETIYEFTDPSTIEAVLGTIDPDNPMAYAVDKALANTASQVLTNPSGLAEDNSDVIKACIIGGAPDDAASWSSVLGMIANEEQIYYLVPLTADPAIQDLVVTHVGAQSTPEIPNYRACFLQGVIEETKAVVDATKTDDETVALATIAVDPDLAGSFTLLTVPANNAVFLTNGVRAGDVVRYQYTIDAFGEDEWTEYVVESVLSEGSLMLVSGPGGVVSTPQRVEIWRTPTREELVTQLVTRATAIGSDRVCLVWPDLATSGGVPVAGYYVCAALAGLAGSVPSHQGLRNVELLGFDSVPRSRTLFRTSNLDAMKDGGVMVVSENVDGTIYVRWAVTTDVGDVNTREEMVRRNADMFRLKLLNDEWAQFVGSANVTDYLAELMRGIFVNLVNRISRTTYNDRLGPCVLAAEITKLEPHATLKDRMVAEVTFVGPYPDNLNQLTLVL